jgi:hypothetical protein
MMDARAFRFYATLLVVALLGVIVQSSFTGQEVAGPLLKSYSRKQCAGSGDIHFLIPLEKAPY